MRTGKRIALVLLAAAALSGAMCAQANPTEIVRFDASKVTKQPPTPFPQFGGKSPNGHEVTVNSQYLILDGKPWLPVMGEFHYSRYPERYWEEQILKMKAGGVQVVATYVFWIHHEEIEGQFDWSGQRNLRHFIELCQKHGMFVSLRIGPWDHGEVRNGGFPDWLLKKGETRKNDPVYLSYVARFYDEIGKQVRGLMWKDGGPIFSVQLENEYVMRGPGAGAEHIVQLKKLAQQAGLISPIYVVTGWMNPEIPGDETLPVFPAYPDNFWDAALDEIPPSANFFFSTVRDYADVATDLLPKNPTSQEVTSKYPYLMAEAAGGMETAYHRRPLMSTDDLAAVELTKLGSGANLYGYYMFQGGTNPDGKLTTLQESQATGFWNDLPEKSYDFQAPLGEFGQMHPSFRSLKLLHYFQNDFGVELAPMHPVFADPKPSDLNDRKTLRAAVRTDGRSGFLFVNNYQRTYALAAHAGVQFTVKLPSQTVTFPSKPVTVPSGAYFIWPVNLDIGGATLRYGTAQPLLRLVDDKGIPYLFFFETNDIAPEFAFDAKSVRSLKAAHAKVTERGGLYIVAGIVPGADVALHVTSAAGKVSRIVVLTKDQAENTWKARLSGRERVVLTPADLFADSHQLTLRSRNAGELQVAVFPPMGGTPSASANLRPSGTNGILATYVAQIAPQQIEIKIEKTRDPEPVDAVVIKRVAQVPPDEAFKRAARWHISVPSALPADVSDVYLKIDYVGDIARLYSGSKLITDNFYKGTHWEVGLKRLPSAVLSAGFDLEVLPLRKDAPIYLPSQAWPAFPPSGQVSEVRRLNAVPEYEVRIEAAPAKRDSATSGRIERRQLTRPYRNQQKSLSDRGAL